MIFPDKSTYLKDAASYRVIPVFEIIGADYETPLSIFIKAGGMFLLESVERGENVGRFSFIAKGKKCSFILQGQQITICEIRGEDTQCRSLTLANPLEEIKNYFSSLNAPNYEGLPPFFGGAIGYLGYETIRYFEEIPIHPPENGVPDGILVIPETLLVYDSVQRTIAIIATTMPQNGLESEYEAACERIASIRRELDRPLQLPESSAAKSPLQIDPLMEKGKFLENVEKCKTYIRDGEIIQAVISQAFTAQTDASPFAIYQRLRHINPSPYLFFLDFADFSIIGSSPEVMVKVQNRELLLKPIAGTRPRGASVSEDARLASELLADEKEKAEHIMLVDLGRNDLGRVAKPGSVEVTDYMTVEKYSHVMHLVSTVKAELDEPYDVFDVIRATFPAGTLSGAPKIRAMQIISELEPHRRGIYGGLVCYLGFNGNFDSCITIRTILMKGHQVRVQAGAGIVADSIPEKEYEETVHKAGALFQAVESAPIGG